jgi:hypothetical protein
LSGAQLLPNGRDLIRDPIELSKDDGCLLPAITNWNRWRTPAPPGDKRFTRCLAQLKER